jgi:hypothetical protein
MHFLRINDCFSFKSGIKYIPNFYIDSEFDSAHRKKKYWNLVEYHFQW